MVKQYIGARYVPVFDGEYNPEKTYEPLTIVTYLNNSYTSKKTVPAGTLPSNSEYWALTGNYNAQVEQYRQEVEQYHEEMEEKLSSFINVKELGATPGSDIADILVEAAERANVVIIDDDYIISKRVDFTSSYLRLTGGVKGGKITLSRSAEPLWAMLNFSGSNIEIDHLTFDDSADRPNAAISPSTLKYNTTLSLNGTGNYFIHDCNFLTGGIWCIYVEGSVGEQIITRNVEIKNNTFSSFIGTHPGDFLDTTCNYLVGENFTITNNKYSSEVFNQTAIELHGNCAYFVSENKIEGYVNGVLLGNNPGIEQLGSVISNNIIDRCLHCVNLFTYQGNVENVKVSSNILKSIFEAGTGRGLTSYAVGCLFTGSYYVNNLDIDNNMIECYELTGSYENDYAFNFSGILVRHLGTTNGNKNVFIHDNVIKNPPYFGIAVTNAASHENVIISHNSIINPVSSSAISTTGSYKEAGIAATGADSVNGNSIISDNDNMRDCILFNHKMFNELLVNGTISYKGNEIRIESTTGTIRNNHSFIKDGIAHISFSFQATAATGTNPDICDIDAKPKYSATPTNINLVDGSLNGDIMRLSRYRALDANEYLYFAFEYPIA